MAILKPDIERLSSKEDIKGLIKALTYKKSSEIRRDAARTLGLKKDLRAVEPLLLALKDENSGVRYEALWALGSLGDSRAARPLIHSLKNGSFTLRKCAAMALGKIKDRSGTEALIQALTDVNCAGAPLASRFGPFANKKDYIRDHAKASLIKLGSFAIESLVLALRDKNPIVRREAAEILDELNWEGKNDTEKTILLIAKHELDKLVKFRDTAVEPLLQDLHQENNEISSVAAAALVKIKYKIKDENLINSLISKIRSDDDLGVRRYATKAIGGLEGSGVEKLIDDLKDKNHVIRIRAAEALGEIGGPQTIDPLIQSLKDKNQRVRWQSTQSLKKKGKRAIGPLIHALKNKDPNVQHHAAEALGGIGNSAVEALLNILEDKTSDAQYFIVRVLGKMGNPKAAEPLIDSIFMSFGEEDSDLIRRSNIFDDYTDLILKAAVYIESKKEMGGDSKNYKISYDLSKSDAAVKKLCEIRTQISSNILQKVLTKRDIKVETGRNCFETFTGTLSFETQRIMAASELKRRGNPPYNSSAYLKKDAWKLKNVRNDGRNLSGSKD